MSTVIINNNPSNSNTQSTSPPCPPYVKRRTVRIQNIAKTFMSHYKKGTVEEFLRSQNYTDAELIMLCKNAKLPYNGMTKDEKLESICVFLNKNRRKVTEFIDMILSTGQLMVASIGIVLETSKLFVACLFWFVANGNQTKFNKSLKNLKNSWNSFKTTNNKKTKRRPTSSVRRVAQTAKTLHATRTRKKLSAVTKQLHSINSVLSKIKRGLFGGPAHAELRQEYDRLKNILEVNQ